MSEKKKEDGLTEGILDNIGGAIPGLGGLLKTLKKSPAFKDKMEEINDELERKFKDTPLKKSDLKTSYGFSMKSPGGSRSDGGREKPFKAHKTERKSSAPREQKEWPADIFDEEDHIKIIVEMPGVDEKEIKVNLEHDVLTISTNNVKRKYTHNLKLPCSPKGKITKIYKNGILEISVKKKGK
jgi:HSP20 family protein